MNTKTKSQIVSDDVSALLRARNALIWVVTREEARVEPYLFEAAAAANYVPRTWDCAQGVADADGRLQPQIGANDAGQMLAAINTRATTGSERGVWVMRDLHVWLSGPIGIMTQRMLRNLARSLSGAERNRSQSIIVISPSSDIPPELAGHAVVIEWPLPDREEIGAMLDRTLDTLPPSIKDTAAKTVDREASIDAAVGLSGEEVLACFSKSIVQLRTIDPVMVAQEKKRVVTRERILEWFDPLPGGLDAVGGLNVVKAWLQERASAYSPEARAYGLPAPKGVLLVGISGCGKSHIAKAVATFFKIPLLRLDLGSLKSKFVGESEANLRKVFEVIKAIGRCVVWIDEVEKALQGASSGAAADGGVSSDALGALLSWMQDRTSEAFLIATANDAEALPPEFLRKGRFDEVFWVDFPNPTERAEVLAAALRTHRRDVKKINLPYVADACDTFTGSEVASLVPDAMFAAFNDGAREITTDDLINVAKTVNPLAKTAEKKIAKLKEWAKVSGARAATSVVADTSPSVPRRRARNLDVA